MIKKFIALLSVLSLSAFGSTALAGSCCSGGGGDDADSGASIAHLPVASGSCGGCACDGGEEA
jgi:hypothetical protein